MSLIARGVQNGFGWVNDKLGFSTPKISPAREREDAPPELTCVIKNDGEAMQSPVEVIHQTGLGARCKTVLQAACPWRFTAEAPHHVFEKEALDRYIVSQGGPTARVLCPLCRGPIETTRFSAISPELQDRLDAYRAENPQVTYDRVTTPAHFEDLLRADGLFPRDVQVTRAPMGRLLEYHGPGIQRLVADGKLPRPEDETRLDHYARYCVEVNSLHLAATAFGQSSLTVRRDAFFSEHPLMGHRVTYAELPKMIDELSPIVEGFLMNVPNGIARALRCIPHSPLALLSIEEFVKIGLASLVIHNMDDSDSFINATSRIINSASLPDMENLIKAMFSPILIMGLFYKKIASIFNGFHDDEWNRLGLLLLLFCVMAVYGRSFALGCAYYILSKKLASGLAELSLCLANDPAAVVHWPHRAEEPRAIVAGRPVMADVGVGPDPVVVGENLADGALVPQAAGVAAPVLEELGLE